MKDAIIIGQGIAGTAISAELLDRGWDVDVADEFRERTASKISSGLYNPLVLKRRRVVWNAEIMLGHMTRLYNSIEHKTGERFLLNEPILESLANPAGRNDWNILADHPKFSPFIGAITRNENRSIASGHFGEVTGSGRIAITELILSWNNWLRKHNRLIPKRVVAGDCRATPDGWLIEGRLYRQIIWCEGYVNRHPHFGDLPFAPTKGEILIVSAPDLKLDRILHGPAFILPLDNDRYKVGSTFSWDPIDDHPSAEGREKLLKAWKKMVHVPCEVLEHTAGVRPNVRDRKPIIGQSPDQNSSYIFSGMGSRGVLIAPWLAHVLANHLESGAEIPAEVDLNRFSPHPAS